jgi:hypothetical protein
MGTEEAFEVGSQEGIYIWRAVGVVPGSSKG